ncbi:Transposon Ty3-G Gag-Pol polyprotein [Labeo rohita]|uniref:ribonuclease H n=1 Tax=Labeo rohita TaxID=84645 RepID=A0ABQ8LMB3_LABRO|nr:Transposon Ty3-G Gag-Pol polyprotein [Labeo rohita]
MPFRPCPTGCGFYLSPNDRHDRCVQCLGREHADAAFAEGGCQNCEDMPLGTLRSRAAFFAKKPRRDSTASRSGPSTSGYEAAAMCVEEERQVLNDALPGTSSQTVHPVCPPMKSPDDFESSSQYGLDLLFGAPAEEKAGSVASEGEPSEADVTAELAAPAVESQSVADAEMAAALKWAAKEIGVVWVPPPSPEPSRLDDWFLGSGRDSRPRSSPVPFFPEVHEELTKSWKAPLSARSRHAISPSLTTLDGGPARGYTEVPQVERAITMHLCPQNAASWRGRPRLPSRACKFSSAQVAKAFAASGQAASALHAMAILQVYQAKVLKDLHEGVPDPELLHEPRSVTDYALRATKVTAQALGRAMSTMVVQERHLWLNLAEMRDAEKARFLDAPISQAGLFGETVEEFAQQFSTVKQQTEAIKHILPRHAASAGPAQRTQQPPPAPRRGRPPTRQDPPNGPALVGRWHRQPVLRPLRTLVRLQSVPETGSPGKEDHLTCLDPHSTRGRALDSASTRLSATWQTATTWSIKEQFPSSLGAIHSTSDPLLDGRMLSLLSKTCGRTTPVPPYALKQRARSDDLPSRTDHLHSSHGSDSLGKTASAVRGFSPPATHCFPSDGTPTLGTPNVTPLRPLAESFLDWLNLPNPSRWLLRTIRLGYAIQFARRPPKFRGVLTTSVQGPNTTVLWAEITVLLTKGAIETVPSAEIKKGFYSPYFIVPKKGGGLRPILDLRVLNRALLKLPFKMLTLKHILTCVRVQDWFVAIDLKDAYFHVSILPRHRPFLRFAFKGRAYQYKVLPFGLSLSPRVFTKVAEAAISPLREMGIRILNYLNDWLILAHSWDLVCAHRDMVLNHLAQLGLRVNWEKSKLSPAQRISFLGVELDSVSMSAHLSPECARSVLRCVATLRCGSAVPLKQVQRLLGHMASSAAVTPLGLMHMRPLQHWLHTRVPRWAWHRGTFRVNITPSCRQTLSPWTDIVFLRSGVPLEQVSRRIIITIDASKTGWGATCNGQAASGVWTGPRLFWHINCLELLAVLLALRRFQSMIQGKHVLVRSDNTVTVAYINHQGGVRSFRMSQLARHLLLWSQHRLKSLRATHIPGEANRFRRVEWRLHPQSVQLIWDRFGQAQVDLFASPESTHCQLWYGLTEAPLGIDALAHSWPRGRLKYAFPPVSLIAQTLCKVREDKEQILLVAPFWPNRTCPSLAHSSVEGPPFSGEGHNLAPAPRSLEPPPLVPGRDQEDFRDLSPSVVNTLLQARAPSTRRLYDLKWRIFVNWCSSLGKDPRSCGIKSVLSFLQEGLDRHLSASTLKVHVAAISANHDLVGGRSVGKHDLIVRFLRGARRLNPPRPHLIPSWDLAVVLQGLQQDPFEPLQSVELDALSFKTALLTALTSIKRVGDLQALSVNSSCLEFGPADSHVVLRPRPGYVPKVPTTPFRDQVVTLQAFSSQEDDPNLTLLCPVRALRIYMERTQPFRRSEQLFVCYGGQQKGKAVSKQRISHWLVDAIRMAYLARGLPCPLEVRAHSTRGIAASAALANGASLTDICRAAGWATPNTFARFYNLRTEPVSARVLIANS